jgi:D-threo-aldose 1-dehydrogenase
VVVGGVYNSGVLAGGGTYDYAAAPPEVIARARRLDEACRARGVPLKAAAIQYPLRHPAVACVLTGARDVRELDENVAAFEAEVPEALWGELAEVR